MDVKLESIQFKSLTQCQFYLRQRPGNKKLIILNHGFMSKAQHMMKWFNHLIPETHNLLAINAPFPIPYKKENNYKMYYSWYFYDSKIQKYYYDYSICTDFVAQLINQLRLEDSQKTIIGFSQGGYAAVHIAEKLTKMDKVIGLGCQFKIQNPQWNPNLKVYAAHGNDDDIVDIKVAQECFQKLPKSHQGDFKVFSDCKHQPHQDMLKWASERALL